MTISRAITDFFNSVYELAASIAGIAYRTVHSAFAAVWGLFSGIINLFVDVLRGGVEFVGGVSRFLISESFPLSRLPHSFSRPFAAPGRSDRADRLIFF